MTTVAVMTGGDRVGVEAVQNIFTELAFTGTLTSSSPTEWLALHIRELLSGISSSASAGNNSTVKAAVAVTLAWQGFPPSLAGPAVVVSGGKKNSSGQSVMQVEELDDESFNKLSNDELMDRMATPLAVVDCFLNLFTSQLEVSQLSSIHELANAVGTHLSTENVLIVERLLGTFVRVSLVVQSRLSPQSTSTWRNWVNKNCGMEKLDHVVMILNGLILPKSSTSENVTTTSVSPMASVLIGGATVWTETQVREAMIHLRCTFYTLLNISSTEIFKSKQSVIWKMAAAQASLVKLAVLYLASPRKVFPILCDELLSTWLSMVAVYGARDTQVSCTQLVDEDYTVWIEVCSELSQVCESVFFAEKHVSDLMSLINVPQSRALFTVLSTPAKQGDADAEANVGNKKKKRKVEGGEKSGSNATMATLATVSYVDRLFEVLAEFFYSPLDPLRDTRTFALKLADVSVERRAFAMCTIWKLFSAASLRMNDVELPSGPPQSANSKRRTFGDDATSARRHLSRLLHATSLLLARLEDDAMRRVYTSLHEFTSEGKVIDHSGNSSRNGIAAKVTIALSTARVAVYSELVTALREQAIPNHSSLEKHVIGLQAVWRDATTRVHELLDGISLHGAIFSTSSSSSNIVATVRFTSDIMVPLRVPLQQEEVYYLAAQELSIARALIQVDHRVAVDNVRGLVGLIVRPDVAPISVTEVIGKGDSVGDWFLNFQLLTGQTFSEALETFSTIHKQTDTSILSTEFPSFIRNLLATKAHLNVTNIVHENLQASCCAVAVYFAAKSTFIGALWSLFTRLRSLDVLVAALIRSEARLARLAITDQAAMSGDGSATVSEVNFGTAASLRGGFACALPEILASRGLRSEVLSSLVALPSGQWSRLWAVAFARCGDFRPSELSHGALARQGLKVGSKGKSAIVNDETNENETADNDLLQDKEVEDVLAEAEAVEDAAQETTVSLMVLGSVESILLACVLRAQSFLVRPSLILSGETATLHATNCVHLLRRITEDLSSAATSDNSSSQISFARCLSATRAMNVVGALLTHTSHAFATLPRQLTTDVALKYTDTPNEKVSLWSLVSNSLLPALGTLSGKCSGSIWQAEESLGSVLISARFSTALLGQNLAAVNLIPSSYARQITADAVLCCADLCSNSSETSSLACVASLLAHTRVWTSVLLTSPHGWTDTDVSTVQAGVSKALETILPTFLRAASEDLIRQMCPSAIVEVANKSIGLRSRQEASVSTIRRCLASSAIVDCLPLSKIVGATISQKLASMGNQSTCANINSLLLSVSGLLNNDPQTSTLLSLLQQSLALVSVTEIFPPETLIMLFKVSEKNDNCSQTLLQTLSVFLSQTLPWVTGGLIPHTNVTVTAALSQMGSAVVQTILRGGIYSVSRLVRVGLRHISAVEMASRMSCAELLRMADGLSLFGALEEGRGQALSVVSGLSQVASEASGMMELLDAVTCLWARAAMCESRWNSGTSGAAGDELLTAMTTWETRTLGMYARATRRAVSAIPLPNVSTSAMDSCAGVRLPRRECAESSATLVPRGVTTNSPGVVVVELPSLRVTLRAMNSAYAAITASLPRYDTPSAAAAQSHLASWCAAGVDRCLDAVAVATAATGGEFGAAESAALAMAAAKARVLRSLPHETLGSNMTAVTSLVTLTLRRGAELVAMNTSQRLTAHTGGWLVLLASIMPWIPLATYSQIADEDMQSENSNEIGPSILNESLLVAILSAIAAAASSGDLGNVAIEAVFRSQRDVDCELAWAGSALRSVCNSVLPAVLCSSHCSTTVDTLLRLFNDSFFSRLLCGNDVTDLKNASMDVNGKSAIALRLSASLFCATVKSVLNEDQTINVTKATLERVSAFCEGLCEQLAGQLRQALSVTCPLAAVRKVNGSDASLSLILLATQVLNEVHSYISALAAYARDLATNAAVNSGMDMDLTEDVTCEAAENVRELAARLTKAWNRRLPSIAKLLAEQGCAHASALLAVNAAFTSGRLSRAGNEDILSADALLPRLEAQFTLLSDAASNTILALTRLAGEALRGLVPHLSAKTHLLTATLPRLLRLLALTETLSETTSESGTTVMNAELADSMSRRGYQLFARLLTNLSAITDLTKQLPFLLATLLQDAATPQPAPPLGVKLEIGRLLSSAPLSRVVSRSARQIVFPGVFALLDRLTSAQKQQLNRLLDSAARVILSEVHDEFSRSYKFQGN